MIFFSGFGIEILKRSDRFYIRYDAGEITIRMVEEEITDSEAIKAQKSEHDAYEIILALQNRRLGN